MTVKEEFMLPPQCPDCASFEVSQVGKIPSTNAFAGRELPDVLDGGYLWQCRVCHLVFRFPTYDKTKLDSLYETGSEDAWNCLLEARRDWKIACRWLHQNVPKGSSILDVGCFDGGFPSLMGNNYKRYGIEIHPEARRRAETKGISLVGTDFNALDKLAKPVDCVTAFDVIEHVHSPMKFLEKCNSIVKQNGCIVVATGNYDARAFRFMGATYWYSTVAEHLSFISPKWCNKVATELGLVVEIQAMFSHGKRDPKHYMPELIKNIIYRITPDLFCWLRQRGLGGKNVQVHPELAMHPPGWMTAKDHFITLFRKY